MKVIFKIKREGEVILIKAFFKGREVMVSQESYEPEDFPIDIKALQHDKDVLIIGDKSKRAQGRQEYIDGILILKRWKELRHFASMPFKKYTGYREVPTSPIEALLRTRVVWSYLSKYGGDKGEAHRTLGMPSEKQNCTLCEYVQLNCSEVIGPNCRAYCPVEWGRSTNMEDDESKLLCYESGSPFFNFVNAENEDTPHAAEKVLDLIDLTIRNIK